MDNLTDIGNAHEMSWLPETPKQDDRWAAKMAVISNFQFVVTATTGTHQVWRLRLQFGMAARALNALSLGLRHPELKLNIPPWLFCLSWCPDFGFRGTYCLQQNALLRRKWQTIELLEFANPAKQELAEKFMRNRQKTLTGPQLEAIVAAPQTVSPLYLRAILEELVVFGQCGAHTPTLPFSACICLSSSFVSCCLPAVLYTQKLNEPFAIEGTRSWTHVSRSYWTARRWSMCTRTRLTGCSRHATASM